MQPLSDHNIINQNFRIMETKVLCFSVYHYNRDELEKMSDEEKLDLAYVATAFGYDEASVNTLKEFETLCNNDELPMDNVWIYFVQV